MTNQEKLTLLTKIRLLFVILAILLLAASAVTGWIAFTQESEEADLEPETETTVPRKPSKYEDDDFTYTFPSTAEPSDTEETYQNPYYNTAPTNQVPAVNPGYEPPATEAPKPTAPSAPTETSAPDAPPESPGDFTTAPTLPPETQPTAPPATTAPTTPPDTTPPAPPAPPTIPTPPPESAE